MQMSRSVGVKRRQRHAVKRRCDEDDPMIAVLEQFERIQSENLPPGAMLQHFPRRNHRQPPRQRHHHQPQTRRSDAAHERGIRLEHETHDPAARHPACRGPGTQRAELQLRILQL